MMGGVSDGSDGRGVYTVPGITYHDEGRRWRFSDRGDDAVYIQPSASEKKKVESRGPTGRLKRALLLVSSLIWNLCCL